MKDRIAWMKHLGRITGLSASLVALGLGTALASGGGEAGGHDNAAVTDLLYRIMNFALLVIVLVFVVRKSSLGAFFSNRREEIQRKLAQLNQERKQAEDLKRDLDGKLKAFEVQRKEILEQLRQEGEAEKRRILAQAEERAAQILANADLAIAREVQAARERLRHELLAAAAKQAEEIMVKSLSERDQDRLVNDFIQNVEKLH